MATTRYNWPTIIRNSLSHWTTSPDLIVEYDVGCDQTVLRCAGLQGKYTLLYGDEERILSRAEIVDLLSERLDNIFKPKPIPMDSSEYEEVLAAQSIMDDLNG